MPVPELTPRAVAWRASMVLAAVLLACTSGLPVAAAQGVVPPAQATVNSNLAVPASDIGALNGGVVIANMHGMLFHPQLQRHQEDVNYARWLGSGVIRVFATDSQGRLDWDGTARRRPHCRHRADAARGARPADRGDGQQPSRRSGRARDELRLDGQLLAAAAALLHHHLARRVPSPFVTALIRTVQARGAQDVIFAWELGNELHTPRRA